MYVGFAISVQEALRLLKLPENTVSSFYETTPIQKYLTEKDSYLTFQYIDKGACLLGVHVQVEEKETCFPYANLEDTFYAIIRSKHIFQREVANLQIDTSYVNITWIEEGEKRVENPQPYVITL